MATHDPQLITISATKVVAISDTEVRVVSPARGAEIIRNEL
jgi:hypothetical protein